MIKKDLTPIRVPSCSALRQEQRLHEIWCVALRLQAVVVAAQLVISTAAIGFGVCEWQPVYYCGRSDRIIALSAKQQPRNPELGRTATGALALAWSTSRASARIL